MSSDGSSAAGQGSRPHKRESRTPMQAAKLSEPPEMEESSVAKTAKTGMLVSRDDQVPRPLLVQLRGLLLVLGGLVLASSIFALWWLQQEEALSLVVLVLLLTLESWFWMGLFLVVVVLPVMLPHMFPLLWKDMVVLVMAVLRLTLESVVNFWPARMHEHAAGRLENWGPHEWVLDSGAWIHHTSKLELLVEVDDFQLQEMDNKDAPSNGDDAAALHAQGRGSVRMGCFDFPGVHYVVGDDTRNVVSVSQLSRDHGLVTVFEPTSCHVKDKKTGHIIGKGRLHNGVYMLDSLRINGQYIGDEGASSGGERGDGGGGGRSHGGGGNKGEEGDSGMAEGRGGGGRSRDGMGGGTGASRNQEQEGSRGGATGGDINDEEIVIKEEEEGSSENGIQEMTDENVDEDDNGKVHQEINGNGEKDKNRGGGRGGSTFGESSNKARTGLFGLSPFVLVLCLCIAACISLLLCTSRWTGVVCKLETFNNLDFRSLLELSFFFIFLGLPPSRTLSMMQPISRELVEQIGSLFRGRRIDGDNREGGDYVQESSHQEHNRRLFGLSRFNVSTDPTGYWRRQLPAGAFPSSINAPRRREFLVDSGASFHATWRELILFPYAQHLQEHTKPPTQSFGGIVGSIEVTRSGYLNGDNIMIDGVLLAPESRMNLVSVGQLSVQYGVQVEMDHVGVVIRKQQDGVRIGGGRMLNNHLYVLEYFDPPGGLFAHLHTPHPNVFGRRPPGPAQ